MLRGLTFPKQMHWDAWLDDGKGELTFGRPIRWLLFLYGGRVVPYDIRRIRARGEARSCRTFAAAPVTYGHRFLTTSGRAGPRHQGEDVRRLPRPAGRALRRSSIARSAASGSSASSTSTRGASAAACTAAPRPASGLLEEVPDLVEYPSVVAGTFAPEFLDLPEEVLTTTMIHHQHWFPGHRRSRQAASPAFLAVTNVAAGAARS